MRLAALVTLGLLVAGSSAGLGDEPAAAALQGVWEATAATLAGEPMTETVRQSIQLEVKGDRYTVLVGGQADRGTCKLGPEARPRTLDITGTEGPNEGKTILAIYERQGDTLRVCYDLGGRARPDTFESPAGSTRFLVEYRLKKAP